MHFRAFAPGGSLSRLRRRRWEAIAIAISFGIHVGALALVESRWGERERDVQSTGDSASRFEAPPAILVDIASMPQPASTAVPEETKEDSEDSTELSEDTPSQNTPIQYEEPDLPEETDKEFSEPNEPEALDIQAPLSDAGFDPADSNPDVVDEVSDVPTPRLKRRSSKPDKPKPRRAAEEGAAASGGTGGRGNSVGRGGDLASSYRAEVAAELAAKRFYPNRARRDRASGIVVVDFVINRRGRASAVRVVRSSGSVHLDDAAKAIVNRASPFPPLPAELGDTLPVRVPLRFDLPR